MSKTNNIKRALFLAVFSVVALTSIVGFLTQNDEAPEELAVGGGPGTINQISPLIVTGGYVKLASSTAGFQVPSLANCDTIDTDGDGKFECGTDGGGGGSATTTINGVTGPTFSFATGTATGIGLTIASSSGTLTFTPTVSSGYSIPLTASTTNWNTAYGWGDHSLAGYLTGVAWGSITGTLSNQTDLQTALNAKQDTLTTGNLTESVTGLQFDATRSVIGGAAALSLSAGYTIPLSASTTEWSTAYASTTALTPAYIRGLFSGTSPVSYNSGTGAIGITADAIGDTELAFNTGQHLTTTSAPTFASSTFSNLTSAVLLTTAGGLLQEYAGTACTNQFVRSLSALASATCAAVSLTADVTGILPIANGGTGETTATAAFAALSPLSTKGDLLTVNAVGNQTRVPVGSNGTVLMSSSSASNGIVWTATSSLGITASAGGSNTQLQYNNAGALAGLSTLTTDGSSLTMTGNTTLATTTITGDFSVNTNDLVIGRATGYLGVGTTSPLYPYHQEADINDTSGNPYGQLNTVFTNPSGNSTATIISSRDEVQTAAGNASNYNILIANAPRVFHNGSGNVTDMRGNNLVASNRSTGTVTTGTGGYFAISNTGGGTFTNGRAGYFNFNNANGIVTNGYGLWADYTNGATATTTNTYGVYIGDVTSGVQTNQAYGLYQVDTGALNYFANNVGIGDTSPSSLLTVGSGDLFQIASNGNLTSSNAGTWTFSNDTNFALSGGINGLSFDTDVLSIDALNNRVGIGTTTPQALLHIASSTSATSTVQIGRVGSVGCIAIRDTDNAGFTYVTALNGVLSASTTSCE